MCDCISYHGNSDPEPKICPVCNQSGRISLFDGTEYFRYYVCTRCRYVVAVGILKLKSESGKWDWTRYNGSKRCRDECVNVNHSGLFKSKTRPKIPSPSARRTPDTRHVVVGAGPDREAESDGDKESRRVPKRVDAGRVERVQSSLQGWV